MTIAAKLVLAGMLTVGSPVQGEPAGRVHQAMLFAGAVILRFALRK